MQTLPHTAYRPVLDATLEPPLEAALEPTLETVLEVAIENEIDNEIDTALQAELETAAALNAALDPALDPALFNGLHVLLSDDNFLTREMTKSVLEDAGFIVDTAEDGQEELQMLCAATPNHYDLIISDVQMPVMNGHEATRAIRALDNPLLASIPIIALSADYFDEDVQAALECGMDAHLAKPLDIQALLGVLSTILVSAHVHVPIDRYERDCAMSSCA